VNIFLAYLTLFLILGSWLLFYPLTCLSLISFVITLFFISKYGFEYLVLKRGCIANCFFKKGSLIYHLLLGKIFLFVISFILSIFFTFTLLSYLLFWDWGDLLLSAGLALALPISYHLFLKFGAFKESSKEILATRLSVYLNAFIFSILLAILHLHQPPPSYLDYNLPKTLAAASSTISSNCPLIQKGLTVVVQLDALKWWLIIKYSFTVHIFFLKAVVWLLFLLSNSLVVYPFSILFMELYRIFNNISSSSGKN